MKKPTFLKTGRTLEGLFSVAKIGILLAAVVVSSNSVLQAETNVDPASSVWSGGPAPPPPRLESVIDAEDARARLNWTAASEEPAQYLGFAWDIYTETWVGGGWLETMWFPFAASSTSGNIDLSRSGAYHIWIASQYPDKGFYPCENPWTGVIQNGQPHKPLDVKATAVVREKTIRLQWKPDLYGTWLYWIIAYNLNTEEWVAIEGEGDESLWHYVVSGSEDFSEGATELTLPADGPHLFFIAAVGWDARTWSEFEMVYTATAPSKLFMLPGGVPLEMVRVPAGSFTMGTFDNLIVKYYNEGPVHTANINYDFHLGKFEVTQKQWLAVMGDESTPYWNEYGIGDQLPAYNITWDDCQDFILKLNAHLTTTGQLGEFHLPSETEWEYACRAGTQTQFFFGDAFYIVDHISVEDPSMILPGDFSDYLWYGYLGTAHERGMKEVGQKLPNQFGLHDMSDNVAEWCQDAYHEYYLGNPVDGSPWETPPSEFRVIRGSTIRQGLISGYNRSLTDCRSARRSSYHPAYTQRTLGFRLKWTP